MTVMQKSVRIALACMSAILLSVFLRLEHYTAAGIIAILSIGDTKQETVEVALRRTLAFILSIGIAYVCYILLGVRLAAYAVYVLLFVFLCLYVRWPEVISINAVLVSHFLMAGSLSIEVLYNEVMLFLAGTLPALAANASLRKDTAAFVHLSEHVDIQMCAILSEIALRMECKSEKEGNEDIFAQLDREIAAAKLCALHNYDNSLFRKDMNEIDYIEMRQKQRMVLGEIFRNLDTISAQPKQAKTVSDFFVQIRAQYHRSNNVLALLQQLETIWIQMRQEELPKSRAEFEARAILFYILKQSEELLLLKREFVLKYHRLYSDEVTETIHDS